MRNKNKHKNFERHIDVLYIFSRPITKEIKIKVMYYKSAAKVNTCLK